MKTRRHFLQRGLTAGAAFTILRSGSARTYAANEKMNLAAIGVGGMGAMNLRACASENIVALCDVDTDYAANTFKEHPKAEIFTDHRRMLEQRKDVEGIIIATPDHTHAHIAMACIRAGKHVYVQKPLAHSVHESRVLTEAARQHKLITQMGNQGHSGEGTRLIGGKSGDLTNLRNKIAQRSRYSPTDDTDLKIRTPSITPASPWAAWCSVHKLPRR